MAGESWADKIFPIVSKAEKGLKLLNSDESRIELAFDANRHRGAGILWLPNSMQALYYSINWPNSGLDFRKKSDFEIQMANIIVGLAMWGGIIHCHRSVMVRQPVIKVCHPMFTLNERNDYLDGDPKDHKQLLWTILKRFMDDITGYYYEYIGPEEEAADVRFQQLRTLSEGNPIIPKSEAFKSFSVVESTPRPTLDMILYVFPKSYRESPSKRN